MHFSRGLVDFVPPAALHAVLVSIRNCGEPGASRVEDLRNEDLRNEDLRNEDLRNEDLRNKGLAAVADGVGVPLDVQGIPYTRIFPWYTSGRARGCGPSPARRLFPRSMIASRVTSVGRPMVHCRRRGEPDA